MNHYLYEITNSITEEKYIGKRSCKCDIDKDKYKGEDTLLSREFRKYGKKQFKKRVLAIIPDEEVTEDLLSIYLKLDKYTVLKESKLGYYKGPRSNTGSKNPFARKVICLNTEEIFETITSAAQKYNISKSAIILACNPNHGNKYAGRNDKGEFLKWMYYDTYIALQNKEEYTYGNSKLKPITKRTVAVRCVETGEVFNSLKEASIAYNVSSGSICNSCNSFTHAGKHPTTGEPLTWEYAK